jgi:alpha-beta hydrolase superfamily lysophospholipase
MGDGRSVLWRVGANVLGVLAVLAAAGLVEASPIRHVTADDAPVLIVHGEIDKTVPIEQSERFASRTPATASSPAATPARRRSPTSSLSSSSGS